MSLLSMIKRYAPELPRPVGNLLASIPFEYRPTIGQAYRRAKALREWYDERASLDERQAFILRLKIYANLAILRRYRSFRKSFFRTFL